MRVLYWLGRACVALERLTMSRGERAFRDALDCRPSLNDNEFYNAFYSDTGIARDLVIDLRGQLESILGYDLGALHPEDNLAVAFPDLDFADVLYCLERHFSVPLPISAIGDQFIGTFDSLLKFVDAQKAAAARSR